MKTLDCYCELYNTSIVKGDGCYVIDETGKRYIDFEAGVWCAALGHNNEQVNQAIINQLSRISHVGERYTAKVVDEAAGMVLELLGFESGKSLFLSSGSEAVEFAVQAVREISSKPYFLHLKNSFLSSYGTAANRSSEEWISIDLSQYTGNAEAFLSDIPFDKIGAFVFEAGCVLRMSNSKLKELIQVIERKVKQNGGIVIANEVTAGIGRTGKWFGFEHFDMTPDVVVCGKGIGNGYPVSIVAIAENIAGKVERSGFQYCQSHQNDPLGCAVVKEVITVIKQQNLIERAADMGKVLENALKNLMNKHSCINEVRGVGLMYVMEFRSDKGFDLGRVHRELFDSGFIVGYTPASNLFVIYPPLTIESKMIEAMAGKLDAMLAKVGEI